MNMYSFAAALFAAFSFASISAQEAPKKEQSQKEWHKGKHKQNPELRQALRKYNKEQVRPIKLEMRKDFDAKLNAQEKAFIETARQEANALHQERKALRQSFGEALAAGKERKELRQEFGPKRKALRQKQEAFQAKFQALLKKYDSDLRLVQTELKTKQEEWKAARMELKKQYAPQELEAKPKEFGHRKGQGKRGAKQLSPEERAEKQFQKQTIRFLLQETEPKKKKRGQEQAAQSLQMKHYPNPVKSQYTVELQLPKEVQKLRIVLRNQAGQEVKNWQWTGQSAGTQNYELNIAELPAGIYFYTVEADGLRQQAKLVKE